MFKYPVTYELKAQGTKNSYATHRNLHILGVQGGWGRPAIGGNVSYVRRLRGGEELSGESSLA